MGQAKILTHVYKWGKLYYWVEDSRGVIHLARAQTLPEGLKVQIVEVFEDQDGQWRWQRKSVPDRHVEIQSESFSTQKKAEADAKLVKNGNKGLELFVLGQVPQA